MLPFFKPKKGFQLAGSGLTSSGGGGGGGGSSGLIYSDDETKIGKVGSEDLYCKSLPMSGSPRLSDTSLDISTICLGFVRSDYKDIFDVVLKGVFNNVNVTYGRPDSVYNTPNTIYLNGSVSIPNNGNNGKIYLVYTKNP